MEWTDFALFLGGAAGAFGRVDGRVDRAPAAGDRPACRPVERRSEGSGRGSTFGARLWRLLPGPSLDGNPVLWREWHRNRPSRLTWLLWWAYFAGLSYGGASVAEVYAAVCRVASLGDFVILLGSGLACSAQRHGVDLAFRGADARHSDVLWPPLADRSIVWGKWWGAFRVVPLLAFWPTVVMAAFAFGKPPGWGTVADRDPGFRWC